MKFLGQFSTFQKTVQKRQKWKQKKVRPTRAFTDFVEIPGVFETGLKNPVVFCIYTYYLRTYNNIYTKNRYKYKPE